MCHCHSSGCLPWLLLLAAVCVWRVALVFLPYLSAVSARPWLLSSPKLCDYLCKSGTQISVRSLPCQRFPLPLFRIPIDNKTGLGAQYPEGYNRWVKVAWNLKNQSEARHSTLTGNCWAGAYGNLYMKIRGLAKKYSR